MLKITAKENQGEVVIEFPSCFSTSFSIHKDDEKKDVKRKENDRNAAGEILGHLGHNSGIKAYHSTEEIERARLSQDGFKKFKEFVSKFPNVKII